MKDGIKLALLATGIIIASMLVVFLVANLLAYWYECGKDMCLWDSLTKQYVLMFTIGTGVVGGFINTVTTLGKHNNS